MITLAPRAVRTKAAPTLFDLTPRPAPPVLDWPVITRASNLCRRVLGEPVFPVGGSALRRLLRAAGNDAAVRTCIADGAWECRVRRLARAELMGWGLAT